MKAAGYEMGDGRRDDHLDGLIHRADLDGLIRLIDDRCAISDWDGLLRVWERSRHAIATGRQLWPATTLAEYRLALWAPAPFVGTVLDISDGLSEQFMIGPLSEVAAQHHAWTELSPHLTGNPHATFVAHERLLRGETFPDGVPDDLPPVVDLPLTLASWEPAYPTATYSDEGGRFDRPDLMEEWRIVEPTSGAEVLDDSEVDLAVRQLVAPWIESSNGRVETICVDGSATDAIGALGVRSARVAELDAKTAIAWLAWAGASGGANGRRRGAVAGRFGAWWLLAMLGQFDAFPPDADAVEALLGDILWYRWDAHEPELGWQLQLVVYDTVDGTSWAFVARDTT